MTDPDDISQYDYDLPEERIAQVPETRRDASRLMVVRRDTKTIAHRTFSDLPDLLEPGDLLILNDTRVVPARLTGFRTATGGKWEGLFLREEQDRRWRMIGKAGGRLRPGETLTLTPADASQPAGELVLELSEQIDTGEWLARPRSALPTLEVLGQFGTMPLPPYVQRKTTRSDWDRYQTLYAAQPGAVAAPTAGLHFTPDVLERCRERGIATARVTLHVGVGTFRPVSVHRLSEHTMHSEWCELTQETVQAIEETRRRQGRVVAVGTTSVRTLESSASTGELRAGQGETSLFIRPPYRFRIVDALITNFHLPKSTLLVLVSTFSTRELVLDAYAEAIREEYRFFSYGDAMLIL